MALSQTPLTWLLIFLSLHLAAAASKFTNPVIWSDFPDNDVFRGPDGTYYLSTSTFQFSPGAPILQSKDLVNWEWLGHSVPVLQFGPGYDNNGVQSYVGGIYASTLRHRAVNDKWYWIGCVNFNTTYIYTADAVAGPWALASTIDTCYYDCGLLIDDDAAQTMYVVYGNSNISIAELSSDGLSQVKTTHVFKGPASAGYSYIEGNRLYKINGSYYVLDDNPSGTTLIWKAESIYGPYTYEILQSHVKSPITDGGLIDQGSLVQAPDGQWYFMSCSWSYPAGRIPILAPIEFNSTGWPILVDTHNQWAVDYAFPGTPKPLSPFTGTDRFQGSKLGPSWEWNFNPDTSKYKVDDGLTMQTATVTSDIYKANNTLTHRVYGKSGNGTVEIDVGGMADGDMCGLAAFRDQTSWIGIKKSLSGDYDLVMVYNASQNSTDSWATVSTGTVVATKPLNFNASRSSSDTEATPGTDAAGASTAMIWLRTQMNVAPSSDMLATFYYSMDGHHFTRFGKAFEMVNTWQYFTGYRYGILNFATKALGGSIKVLSFSSTSDTVIGDD